MNKYKYLNWLYKSPSLSLFFLPSFYLKNQAKRFSLLSTISSFFCCCVQEKDVIMWNKLNALCTRNEKEGTLEKKQSEVLEKLRLIQFSCKWDKIFDSLCMIIEHGKKKINSLKMFFTNKQSLTQQTQHCCQLKRTNSREKIFLSFPSRVSAISMRCLRYFWLLNNKARPFWPFYASQTLKQYFCQHLNLSKIHAECLTIKQLLSISAAFGIPVGADN